MSVERQIARKMKPMMTCKELSHPVSRPPFPALDKFERELDAELAKAIQKFEKNLQQNDGANSSSSAEVPLSGVQSDSSPSGSKPKKRVHFDEKKDGADDNPTIGSATEPQFYDQDYFDSDSDEEANSGEKKSRKHAIPSNDELFYDPGADAADQRWVDKQL